MGTNKKIKNAETSEYDRIQFRSKLEERVYKKLREALNVEIYYEQYTYDIIPAFDASVYFYSTFVSKKDKVRKVTYTPDLVFTINGYTIIIECKGFPNDVYPLKRKLFRRYLESLENKDKILFFEIKHVKECETIIQIINEKTK